MMKKALRELGSEKSVVAFGFVLADRLAFDFVHTLAGHLDPQSSDTLRQIDFALQGQKLVEVAEQELTILAELY